jgi:hypothetical protein
LFVLPLCLHVLMWCNVYCFVMQTQRQYKQYTLHHIRTSNINTMAVQTIYITSHQNMQTQWQYKQYTLHHIRTCKHNGMFWCDVMYIVCTAIVFILDVLMWCNVYCLYCHCVWMFWCDVMYIVCTAIVFTCSDVMSVQTIHITSHQNIQTQWQYKQYTLHHIRTCKHNGIENNVHYITSEHLNTMVVQTIYITSHQNM